MKLLITGGNGLLGRHLIEELLARGDRVRVLALPGEDASWLERRGVAVHRGDVRRRETLLAPTEGVEAVVHLAAMMGAWRPLEEYRAVNVDGTKNVCSIAHAQSVSRLLHISSWTVYGMGLRRSAHEELSPHPFREPYGISKAEGERVVQRMIAEEGLPAVVLRPGTFFGPGDRLHFGRVADRLRAGKGIVVGGGDNALPLVYVTDVVQGILLGLDHEGAVGQTFNIANDRPLTQLEFMTAVARAIGAPAPRVHVPYAALYAAGCAAERLAWITSSRRQPVVTRLGVKLFGGDNRHSIDKARRELGYRPRVALQEGVERAASWYMRQKPER